MRCRADVDSASVSSWIGSTWAGCSSRIEGLIDRELCLGHPERMYALLCLLELLRSDVYRIEDALAPPATSEEVNR